MPQVVRSDRRELRCGRHAGCRNLLGPLLNCGFLDRLHRWIEQPRTLGPTSTSSSRPSGLVSTVRSAAQRVSSPELVSVIARPLTGPPPREALLPTPVGARPLPHPSHPTSVGLACRRVGACRRHLVKRLKFIRATGGACVTVHSTTWITRSPIPETSTADLRAAIRLQIGGELRKT